MKRGSLALLVGLTCLCPRAEAVGGYGLVEATGQLAFPVVGGRGELGAGAAVEGGVTLLHRILQLGARFELGRVSNHDGFDDGALRAWYLHLGVELRAVWALREHLKLGAGIGVAFGYWSGCWGGDVCGELGPNVSADLRLYVPLVEHFALDLGLRG